jgi:hypothetical protein
MGSQNTVMPFTAAAACIEWCKTNFESMAAMGFQQRTGIYMAAWGQTAARDVALDSGSFRTVIRQADSLGATRALFVAAAGNAPGAPQIPAALGLANLVAVTFSDQSDNIGGNTGDWVDVAVPDGSSSDAVGTAAGVAALMVSANPSLTPQQLKAAIRAGADPIPSMQGKVGTNGRLNASRAFDYLEQQGLVHKNAQPDQSLCDASKTWAPAWPSAQLPCGAANTDATACWQVFAAQF